MLRFLFSGFVVLMLSSYCMSQQYAPAAETDLSADDRQREPQTQPDSQPDSQPGSRRNRPSKWDPQVGLWWSGKGHTASVAQLPNTHASRAASDRLLDAALEHRLSNIDAERVLSSLRQMQVLDGSPLQGCLRWYWEEDKPSDTNAAFFVGMNLLLVNQLSRDQLSPRGKELIDAILGDLSTWFAHELQKRPWYYPNKSLGEVMCAWLIYEQTGRGDRDELLSLLRDCAQTLSRDHWGWGEHMSDIYSEVCQDELSMLVLMSPSLPDDVRQQYVALADELLMIGDFYDGGPRVPALRSYAFSGSRRNPNYRRHIAPLEEGRRLRMGNVFYNLGWRDRFAQRKDTTNRLSIPCFGGAVATACIESDIRIGSMSRWPSMPSAEALTWGNSWQAMPLAMWRPEGDWGFLQWFAAEDGVMACHPAENKRAAYLRPSLTQMMSPPVVGQTYALQRDGEVLVLRIMPAVMTSWQQAGDRLRLCNPSTQPSLVDGPTTQPSPTTRPAGAGAWGLTLTYPQRTVGVGVIDLAGEARPQLSVQEKRLDFGIAYDQPALVGRRNMVHLWAFSLSGALEKQPTIRLLPPSGTHRSLDETAVEVVWQTNATTWHVQVDPLAQQPLVDLGGQ